MTIPELTAAPDLPDRTEQDQTTFDSKMAAYWAYLKNDFEPELNLITLAIDLVGTTAVNAANTATNQGSLAEAQVDLAADQVALATTQVALATTQAENAASSAQTALLAPGTSANSSTSIATGLGPKTFTIETGKLFVAGMTLKADSNGNWIIGTVSSYNSGTGELILNVTNISGTGTYSNWIMSVSAPIPDVPGGYNLFSFQNYI